MDSNANNNDINNKCEDSMQETVHAISDNVAEMRHNVPRVEQIATSKIQGLDEFFARPVRIASGSWAINTPLEVSYDTYNLWGNNPNVRAKLRNFSMFRGNLRVRVIVNATKFHYGYLMASWVPFGMRNEILKNISPNFPANREQLRAFLSQSPDTKYLMVNDNGTIEMTCPFIYYNNYYRFENGSGVINIGQELFTDNAGWYPGDLFLYALTDLSGSSGATAAAEFTVMAWMEDVELFPPTLTNMKLESTKGEMGDGPISSVASAIANAARSISSFPIVGPYALATSKLSDGIAHFSALFGFSRPLLIENTKFVKEYTYANEANANGSDSCYSLSLDVKRELTQDQSIVGDSTDPMDIAMICARESYLQGVPWNTTHVEGNVLLSIPCHGTYTINHGVAGAGGTVRTMMLTPAATALSQFRYYRCTIVFRFVVVASMFNRGRLWIGYEPTPFGKTFSEGFDINMNNQMGTIWDIQASNEIVVRVPFCFQTPFVETDPRLGYAVNGIANTLAGFSNPNASVFGWLAVKVLNPLISQDASQVVEILQFVHLEDVEVMKPWPALAGYKATPESSQGEMNCCDILGSVQDDPNIFLYHGGECVKSLRSLIRRYSGQAFYAFIATSTANSAISGIEMPYQNKEAYTGSMAGVSSAVYLNGCTIDMLKYCFVGMRGGIRYKFFPILHSVYKLDFVKAGLAVMPDSIPEVFSDGTIPDPAKFYAFGNDTTPGPTPHGTGTSAEGTVTFSGSSDLSGIEVEVPYYSQRLFDVVSGSNYDYFGSSQYINGVRVTAAATRTGAFGNAFVPVTGFQVSCAAAEDFTFLRFQSGLYLTEPAAV